MCWFCYVCEGDSVVYVCYMTSTLFMYSVCSDGCVVGYVWCFMFGVEFYFFYHDYVDVVLSGCLCEFRYVFV